MWTAAALERIEPLLSVLRGFSALVEVRPATFHLAGRDFLHFHDKGSDGIVADVRLARGRLRMPVSTTAEQAELLQRIEESLMNLELHSRCRRAGTRDTRDARRTTRQGHGS